MKLNREMETSSQACSQSKTDRSAQQRRNLFAASLAHALHDGYTDALYAFLPIWQAQFALSYATLAVVRALYYATMGAFQIPADRCLQGFSPRTALILSTVVASMGLIIVTLPFGFAGLCIGLVVAGIGSSIQHPCGSMIVVGSFGNAARGPLGIYNFSGDLGKAVFPALVAVLLPLLAWRPVLGIMAMFGFVLAIALASLAPADLIVTAIPKAVVTRRRCRGFGILTTIGALDTSTRMGYLLFLPFLIHAQGGDSRAVGFAFVALFSGGAFGKAVCGWLGHRLGVGNCVMVTEAATALLITATLFVSLEATLLLLPLLGVVLNGTSSVLYGTVPELSDGDTGRAFAIFYTSVIGSGGVAPILYGAIADHTNQRIGILASAATAALIVTLVPALQHFLSLRANLAFRL